MIPEELKNMFGLKDEKDMNMANNIWKMLDQMSQSDPEQYKSFVQKNVKQGMSEARHKTQQKQKPYKIKPKAGFCLSMKAALNEKPLAVEKDEKLLITKTPWADVKKNFPDRIRITLSITYSERVRDLTSKKTKKAITRFPIAQMTDIECFYYSFQGPLPTKKDEQFDVCLILNSVFFADLMNQPQGKRIIMGLCMSYLQDRLTADKNPLLKLYNPQEYKRLAFYNIDKYSIQVQEKTFKYGENHQPIEFLLQNQVDKKRLAEQEAQKQKQPEVKPKKPEIIFKETKTQEPAVSEIKISEQEAPKNKKVLIEVLKEEENQQSDQIAYNMKECPDGYNFQFLLPGVNSIKEVNLEMKSDCVLLKTQGKKDLKIQLKRPINEASIKAKFKKIQKMLKVSASYL